MLQRVLLLMGVLTLVSCSGNETSPSDPGPVLKANIVEILQGDGQTDTVNQQLPVAIRVQVLDTTAAPGGSAFASAGVPAPVPGQLVNFVAVSGGGRAFAGSAITDDSGRAEDFFILGPSAGAQCMEARAVVGGVPVTYATACATAVAGPLAHAGFNADTIVIPGDSILRIPAWATDSFNNPVPVPAPGNPDAMGLAQDSLGWKSVPGTLGWFRLVLGGDTLVVAEHLPRGRYRVAYHHADTAWVEEGRMNWPNQLGTGDFCSVFVGFTGYTGQRLRTYRADSVYITRQVGAGAVDSLDQNTSHDQRACSAVDYGLSLGGTSNFRLRVEEFLTAAQYHETDLSYQIAPFTFVMPPGGGRADTLWFGLP